ncbi:hypothetical protein [Teredinibacter turnerae]|uniref:hypothetical protein n=1 Tax=Teredinibacter turnerae TaxID=2426 RepID=UPI0030D215FE
MIQSKRTTTIYRQEKGVALFLELLSRETEQWPKNNEQYALLKQALFETEHQN